MSFFLSLSSLKKRTELVKKLAGSSFVWRLTCGKKRALYVHLYTPVMMCFWRLKQTMKLLNYERPSCALFAHFCRWESGVESCSFPGIDGIKGLGLFPSKSFAKVSCLWKCTFIWVPIDFNSRWVWNGAGFYATLKVFKDL